MALAALLLAPWIAVPANEVSVQSLLGEMGSFDHLLAKPAPAYVAEQASSYDRKSNPGPGSDPFANGDAGQFLRTERHEGRTEFVLADLRGPGAVVRVWSANPAGILRFYFDDEAEPRLQAKMDDLLRGRIAPFFDPFAYTAARGTNLYFPFPYAKRLKVTVQESGDSVRGLYYHVGYRTYRSGTPVRTYSARDLGSAADAMRAVASRLSQPASLVPPGLPKRSLAVRLPSGQATGLRLRGPVTVRQLTVRIPFPLVQTLREMDWADPHQPHNVLRKMRLDVRVDGRKTISTPLGDFFGTAPGVNPYVTLPFEVRSDGTMISRLPIPARSELAITISNETGVEVPLSGTVEYQPSAPAGRFYTLHAQWQAQRGATRPMVDMNLLNVKGDGIWFGSHLHVENPTPAWWGEGDEKVYVDHEPFPSTFGTGTEDYYGYAWCDPGLFAKPYHAQPRCDGPGNFGHTSVNRWHVLDPIPFSRALRFDLEKWHWAEVQATFAYTSYWYAPPGSAEPVPLDENLLLPGKLSPPEPVKGALEGETLRIVSKTGNGIAEAQSGFWELSAGKQLWWRQVATGDKLVLAVPVREAGRYAVFGNFCRARDYGIHKIRLNGRDVGEIDFFGTGVEWHKHSLGVFDLPAGEVLLEIECVGKRPEALEGRMFGLDYLLLEKR